MDRTGAPETARFFFWRGWGHALCDGGVRMSGLQWGGRFASEARCDRCSLSVRSLDDDLPLAQFDLRCSRAHVAALEAGGILAAGDAIALRAALDRIGAEIDDGTFAAWATQHGFEDVHGAIDARVRAYAGASANGCTPAGHGTIRSRRRCCSTYATARSAGHSSRSMSRRCAKIAPKVRSKAHADGGNDALAAGQPVAARVSGSMPRRKVLSARPKRFARVAADGRRFLPPRQRMRWPDRRCRSTAMRRRASSILTRPRATRSTAWGS